MRKKELSLVLTLAIIISTVLVPMDTKAQTTTHSEVEYAQYVKGNTVGDIAQYSWQEDGEEIVLEEAEQEEEASEDENLPSKYDSRKKGLVSSAKKQGLAGTCWAFSALKNLEISSVKQGYLSLEDANFSETHLAWYSYRSNPYTNDLQDYSSEYSNSALFSLGGNFTVEIASLASWVGPTLEAGSDLLTYHASTSSEIQTMADNMLALEQNKENILGNSVHLKDANRMTIEREEASNVPTSQSLQEVKEAIYKDGSVSAPIYWNNSYYDSSNYSYYASKDGTVNHQIVIIGWNDNYAKENFDTQPSKDGAWLIMNSWGESWGENGCCWVSYEDPSLSEVYDFEVESQDAHELNFQYDGIGYDGNFNTNNEMKIANIFTNTNDQAITIDAVGVYTLAGNQSVKIQVYTDLEEHGTQPDDGLEAVSLASQNISYAGYHTLDLGSKVRIEPGEKFSIVATYEYNGAKVYVPVEGQDTYGSYTFKGTDQKIESYQDYNSQENQSYISFFKGDAWYDLSKYSTSYLQDQLSHYFITSVYNNVCLKALGNYAQEETNGQEKEDEKTEISPDSKEQKEEKESVEASQSQQVSTKPTLKKISLSQTSYTYNGKVKKPSIKAINSLNQTMKEGRDYVVTYPSGRKNVGTYRVTIKGKGNYQFTKKLSFTIVPGKAKLSKVNSSKKSLVLTLAKSPGKIGASKYQIKYRLLGSASWKSISISSNKKILKKLKSGKKYQIKVRAYKKVASHTYYGAYTSIKTSKKIK